MNNGFNAGNFKNKLGARQGDPISVCHFVLVIEILFIQVRKSDKIQGPKVSAHEFLLSEFADDSNHFVRNSNSIQELFRLH